MMPPAATTITGRCGSSGAADREPVGAEGDGPVNVLLVGLCSMGKKYHCQRCLNHGLEIPRKGHKMECVYSNCRCDDCKLVEKRKILNREINNERDRVSDSPVIEIEDNIEPETNPGIVLKVRNPRCARCRAHDPEKEPPPLKGHKKACRYKNCECKKCSLITRRRDVMAKQIRLRRKQKTKSVSADSESSNHSPVADAPVPTASIGQGVSDDQATPPPATNDETVDVASRPPSQVDTRPPMNHPTAPQPSLGPSPVHCSNVRGQLQFHAAADPSPYRDYNGVPMCPQAVLANCLQYLQTVVAGAQQAGGGLTLPTLPASVLDQAALFAPRPPLCAIPCYFPPNVLAVPQQAPFHHPHCDPRHIGWPFPQPQHGRLFTL